VRKRGVQAHFEARVGQELVFGRQGFRHLGFHALVVRDPTVVHLLQEVLKGVTPDGYETPAFLEIPDEGVTGGDREGGAVRQHKNPAALRSQFVAPSQFDCIKVLDTETALPEGIAEHFR